MQSNLSKLVSWLFFFLILMLFIVMTYSQLYVEYKNFKTNSEDRRIQFVEQQKSQVKNEVLRAVKNIKYEQNRTEDQLKANIKNRVNRAYAVIHTVWEKYKSTRSKSEIIFLIREALRPVRFSEGRGYYYIMDLDGNEILNPAFPKMEGINWHKYKESYVRSEVLQTLDFFSDQKVEDGFFESRWEKPTLHDSKKYQAMSYLRLFKPYRWLIGTSEYIDDVTKNIQNELLNQIADYRFNNEGYIFINQYDGIPLLSNGKRLHSQKKMWQEFGDPAKIVFEKEMRAAKKNSGDFIYYSWPKLNSDSLSQKVSFIYGIPQWKWLIGAGVYLDDVEHEIQIMQEALFAKFKFDLIRNMIIFILILSIFILIRSVLVRLIKKEFHSFFSSFKQAAQNDELINLEAIRFQEFRYLAENANSILQEKISATQNLFKEKEYLAVTLNSINDGVIATDSHNIITSVNKAAKAILSCKSDNIIGKDLAEFLPSVPDQIKQLLEDPAFSKSSDRQRPVRPNHESFVCTNSEQMSIEFGAAPLRNANNQKIGIVVVFRDISDKLKAEEEILNAKKLESVGILAGGIAHDFNNLLAGIFGNISLAKIYLEPESKPYHFIETAEETIERATGLTKQLLTFAKGGEPVKDLIDVAPLIEEQVKFILRGSNVKPEFELQDDLWPAEVDKGQFSQVIANLVINARQAMPEGGTIQVKLENIKDGGFASGKTDKQIKISIRDFGIGIPKKYLNKIFDPYFTTKNQGNGLGLAMVYSIIQKHKGHIEVQSKQNQGTTFLIYLPAKIKDGIKSDSSHPEEQPDILDTLKGRVLLMDDEDVIRDTGTKVLNALGLEVLACEEGSEAVKLYETALKNKKPFDMVIVDLTIPGGMGGLDTLEEIIKIDPQAKVIVSSGYSTDPIMARYQEFGFAGRIEKPYLIEQIQKLISDILNHS